MGYLNPEDGEQSYAEGTEAEAPIDPSLLDEQPLPAIGDYPNVVCTEADLTKSKKGNAMVVVTLSSSEPEASSRYYIVNSKGGDRFSTGLAVFGLTQPQVKDALVKGGKEAVAQFFVGKKVSAKGVHDTYLGSKNFKFDNLTAPAEGAGFREFGSDPTV